MAARALQFGPYTVDADVSDGIATPYFLAGPHMYVVGTANSAMTPIGAEHLVGEMGGIWAHPIKVADGVTVALAGADGTPLPLKERTVTEALTHIDWRERYAGLRLQRRDLVADEAAAFVMLLELENTGGAALSGEIELVVWLKFLGCWFGALPSGGGYYWHDGAALLGADRCWPEAWGVACGTGEMPARCEIAPRDGGTLATLAYPFALAPGARAHWQFTLVGEHEGGHAAARHTLEELGGQGAALLARKIAHYEHSAFGGVALASPDPAIDRGFALAKANFELLRANYAPNLPPYFLAGIPEYPQLFGCDTEYTIPGAVAAGFAETSRSALLALASYGTRACGRIPHEVTTNGRVFHPGNTQETPQFAIACWDFFRWTGDRAFLEQVFPLCREGIDQYMPALWGAVGGIYPIGDGVVERPGMGVRKLDSTCYLFGALRALRGMTAALDMPAEAARYETRLDELRSRFEQDWWLEDEGMYADSLHTDLRPQFDGHWTVALPLQLGMASEERARRALDRIEREWVNEWGLVHTRGRENSVWTLPTGVLALVAFRYGKPELGVRLLNNIAATTERGTLGTFKELIPIGLCFVQLWSAGLYVQGLVEGLFGLRPLAHRHELAVAPCLPAEWPAAQLNGLRVGAHLLDIRVTSGGLRVAHRAGSAPLHLRYRLPGAAEMVRAALHSDAEGTWLELDVPVGTTCQIALQGAHLDIQTDSALAAV